jgi:hypothetical protein
MLQLRKTTMGTNRAAWNRLVKKTIRAEINAWCAQHYEQLPPRDPAVVAAEDAAIAAKRESFPLH